jgi:drug/metabolite transporter (DMT)-like permease
MCLYTAIKYFPLVVTSLMQNISPLLIAFFSWLLFRVKLNILDIGTLLISFAGVVILISGTITKVEDEEVA